jgi:hypothetical protein
MFRADLKRSWDAMKFAPLLIATTAGLAAAQRLARDRDHARERAWGG